MYKAITNHWRIQDYPDGGGMPTYYFDIFPPKIHEIENILTESSVDARPYRPLLRFGLRKLIWLVKELALF